MVKSMVQARRVRKYRVWPINTKNPAHEDNNQVSEALAGMLRTYTARMRDTSQAANDFFEDMQSALGGVLLRHGLSPLPKPLKIINTSKMKTHFIPDGPLHPPLVERQRGRQFGPPASIGILWDAKPEQDKDGKAQISYSTFLKLDLPDSHDLDYNLYWVESPQAITGVHV